MGPRVSLGQFLGRGGPPGGRAFRWYVWFWGFRHIGGLGGCGGGGDRFGMVSSMGAVYPHRPCVSLGSFLGAVYCRPVAHFARRWDIRPFCLYFGAVVYGAVSFRCMVYNRRHSHREKICRARLTAIWPRVSLVHPSWAFSHIADNGLMVDLLRCGFPKSGPRVAFA